MPTFAEQVRTAIAAHGQWKVRLRDAISTGDSEFKVAVVKLDNQCPFGKWLYGGGQHSFPSVSYYEQVRELHARFHEEAARVLLLATTGKTEEAKAALASGSAFSKISGSLVGALSRAPGAAA